MKLKFQFVSLLFLAACASSPSAKGERAFDSVSISSTQFYIGKIQRSSLDQSQMYGPKFDSLVKRVVDGDLGKIQECVFQEGKSFLTTMVKTVRPLEFEVQDTAGYSKGFLVFSDETLTSWSYDIEVVKPFVGKISGSLADGNGANIFPDGKMEIRKIWDNKMLIHEIYNQISHDQYSEYLKNMSPNGTVIECL